MKIEIFGIKNKAVENKYKRYAKIIIGKNKGKIPKESKALNIIIVSDNYIRSLNKKFLNRDRPTDVLSFPIKDVMRSDIKQSEDALLGEIYISHNRARVQAKEQGTTQNEEMCNLIEHGILHLLGYSHQAMRKLRDSRIEKVS